MFTIKQLTRDYQYFCRKVSERSGNRLDAYVTPEPGGMVFTLKGCIGGFAIKLDDECLNDKNFNVFDILTMIIRERGAEVSDMTQPEVYKLCNNLK